MNFSKLLLLFIALTYVAVTQADTTIVVMQPRTVFVPTGFDDNDGFGQSYFTRCGEKRPSVPNGLHIDDNAAGVWVVPQVIDQVAPANVEH